MRPLRIVALFVAALALLALFGCATPPATETTVEPTADSAQPTADSPEPTADSPEPTADSPEPTADSPEPTAEADGDGDLPPAVFYDLGETTLVQDNFAEDSRFRNMPARLNGVMAAPVGEGAFPVVVVLHGTHPGCPVVGEVDVWPCEPEVEQRNYAGFEYLVRELAARGYVALAPNINAEFTFGFGEPIAGVRLRQLLDQHLRALVTAAGGGDNAFGVDLAGVADPSRLVLIGHSQGGEMANFLTRQMGLTTTETVAKLGYGPVLGLLLVAPAHNTQGTTGSDVPLAVILPACDGDVMGLDGQHFYEAVRFQEAHSWATTALLEAANHNGFNSILGGDMVTHSDRPACQTLLAPEEQQQFLIDYTADFLTTLFGAEDEVAAAKARLGLDITQPAPTALYGRPARVTFLPAAADRLPLFTPAEFAPTELSAGESALLINDQGGTIDGEGATLFYCPEGYTVEADLAACRRPNFVNPGNPIMAIVDWAGPAEVGLGLADGQDLSGYTTLTLRAVLDPLSESNPDDQPQSFTVRLRDGSGATSAVIVGPDTPALQFSPGTFSESDSFPPGLFAAVVHMTTVRVPLAAFTGVDLSDIDEVALVFDQTASGTLFVADVEVGR